MDSFRIRPLGEEDVDAVIMRAGGCRAFLDHHRRKERNADYVLEDTIIELKILEEEGLAKTTHQVRLAELFKEHFPSRPVIVLDRDALPPKSQRTYDRILEAPIKTAVASARKQLKQSRIDIPGTRNTILWIINSGYTALDHDSLVKLVSRRVRNDTQNIDGVVVSGCYFYSDSIDYCLLCPIDYVPVNLSRIFTGFDQLRNAWSEYANHWMTQLLQREPSAKDDKGPVVDIQFECGGTTYVNPAPPMGSFSNFYPQGRPRIDSTGMDSCPPVATTSAKLSRKEWGIFHDQIGKEPWLGETYEDWLQRRSKAVDSCRVKPFVEMPVTWEEWRKWIDLLPSGASESLSNYANELFQCEILKLLENALERSQHLVTPSAYILVITEEIGQDRANDVSHIAEVHERPDGEQELEEILVNQRMFHEYALAVACAHALARGIKVVMWQKDRQYAWV